uniref:HAUS augmin-like complex subunit 3 N-terminal domain-containing protein n=2 Tax=Aegilops tauschii subsp. strangulata TaxID=200361 RepID=A0A453BK76_AEGTS
RGSYIRSEHIFLTSDVTWHARGQAVPHQFLTLVKKKTVPHPSRGPTTAPISARIYQRDTAGDEREAALRRLGRRGVRQRRSARPGEPRLGVLLQGDDSSRVLAWIAARLRRANVLSASDLELYDQLELEGKLLEGKDLDSAFDSISAFSETGENHEYTFLSEESLGDIRDSKLALRAEVSDLEKKLASLEWQLDLLTAQATTITQGKKSRTSAKTSATGKLARFDEELAKRSLEMNAVLGKLVATIQELSYYHSEADIGVYLSYCDFQSYVISNLACTKELNTWFTKKFEKGALRFVAKEDMPRGDSEKPRHFVVELKRINSVTSKHKWNMLMRRLHFQS